MRYRGLEGFVAAVTPFNFTAIGGNLAYTPALAVAIQLPERCVYLYFYILFLFFLGMLSFMETFRYSSTF